MDNLRVRVKGCLGELDVRSFSLRGIAKRLGVTHQRIREEFPDSGEIHPAFVKFEGSQKRWFVYNKEKVLVTALASRNTKEFAVKMKEKFGVTCDAHQLRIAMEGSDYKMSRTQGRCIYRDVVIREIDKRLWSYIVGYFIGDGSFGEGNNEVVYWATRKPRFLRRLLPEMPIWEWREYESKGIRMYYLVSFSENVRKELFDIGIPERKTYIPFEIDMRRLDWYGLLAGLIDSDGTTYRHENGNKAWVFGLLTSSEPFYKQILERGDGEISENEPLRVEGKITMYRARLSGILSKRLKEEVSLLLKGPDYDATDYS